MQDTVQSNTKTEFVSEDKSTNPNIGGEQKRQIAAPKTKNKAELLSDLEQALNEEMFAEDIKDMLGISRTTELKSLICDLMTDRGRVFKLTWRENYDNGTRSLPQLKVMKGGDIRISGTRLRRMRIEVKEGDILRCSRSPEGDLLIKLHNKPH